MTMSLKEAFRAINDCCVLGLAAGLGLAVFIVILAVATVFGNWIYYTFTDKPITTSNITLRIAPSDAIEQVTNE